MANDQITTLVTAREDGMHGSTLARTTGASPDLCAVALPPWRIVLTRVLRVYAQSFVMIWTVTSTGVMASAQAVATGMTHAETAATLPSSFLSTIYFTAMVAGMISFGTLIQNALELLVKLDETKPQLRG